MGGVNSGKSGGSSTWDVGYEKATGRQSGGYAECVKVCAVCESGGGVVVSTVGVRWQLYVERGVSEVRE